MSMTIPMNAMVRALVLILGLISPMVAQGGCIDDCSTAPAPSGAESGSSPGHQSAARSLTVVRQPKSLVWDFKSNFRYKVGIKFYSQTRKGHEWPSSDRMWILDDYKTHTYRLSCVAGEKICYGAWSTGNDKTYWGSGHGDKQGCPDCCYTCGDNTRRKILNP